MTDNEILGIIKDRLLLIFGILAVLLGVVITSLISIVRYLSIIVELMGRK